MEMGSDVLMSQPSDVLLTKTAFRNNAPATSSVSPDNRFADDVIMSSSGIDYPPNVAISPGSCKSPYCCTSPGFCNFPYHHYKARHFATTGNDVTHDAISRTRSDPFPRDQVFIPDSAETETVDFNNTNNRRQSVPSLHDPLPIIKPDALSLPGITDQDGFMNSFAPITSLSPSSSSLSSSESIFSDPLLVDVTGNDVMGLMRLPKVEVSESNCFDITANVSATSKTPSISSSSAIRRSPPPPNVTLNPEKHKRSTLPQG